ncbi:MAG TPA: NAD(P)-dependent oxidoreductase [Gemmataceae bacterium]|jgi:uronate dehydrogenase
MSLVLVTGATGEVGRGVLPWLEEQFSLRLLSLDPPNGDPRCTQADLLDWHALSAALRGVDSVLHLAIAPGHSGVYEEDAFNDQRFDVNVKGTFHVFEAARRAKVRRIVHVSSLMVLWGHGMVGPIPGDALPRPTSTYALTKTLTEDIARHYADRHGMEVITLRIATPLDIDNLHHLRRPVRPQQVPLPDLGQAFVRALSVPLERYEIVTIVGESSRRIWDLEPARRVLGYEPRYRLDDFVEQWADPFAVEP